MTKQAASKTRSVRGSRTGRPIMTLLDLLGRRWSLRILWELRGEPLTSRALRTACDEASPTVLQARLTELREAGFVEARRGWRLWTDGAGRGAVRDVYASAPVCGAVAQQDRRLSLINVASANSSLRA